mmetsp:Transcript_38782/g.28677  ORF Transcript_38782/g.28677 Transcript_38782/m.28677 type:complete len:274 (+) Transcript_38782:499-1320(+)
MHLLHLEHGCLLPFDVAELGCFKLFFLALSIGFFPGLSCLFVLLLLAQLMFNTSHKVRISKQPIRLEVVDEHADGFETEEVGQVLFHLPKQPLVVSLSAYLARQSKCFHYCIFFLSDFFKCHSPFEPHLKIKAENLDNLFIRHLKPHMLSRFPINLRLALHHQYRLFIPVQHRVRQPLHRFESISHVFRFLEARLAHFFVVFAEGVHPLPALHCELLDVGVFGLFDADEIALDFGVDDENSAVLALDHAFYLLQSAHQNVVDLVRSLDAKQCS